MLLKYFGARYDVMFNARKTMLTKFGNSNDISKEFVEFNDNCIQCEDSACHLGNNIGFNMERDNLSNSINEFVSNITRIKASFSYAGTEVVQWIWSKSKLQNVSHLLLLMATSSYTHFEKYMRY